MKGKFIMDNQELDLSIKLKLIRTRERLTQKEIADLVDIPLGTYKNYEQGLRRGIGVLEIMKIFNHERFNKYLAWFMCSTTKLDKQVSPE